MSKQSHIKPSVKKRLMAKEEPIAATARFVPTGHVVVPAEQADTAKHLAEINSSINKLAVLVEKNNVWMERMVMHTATLAQVAKSIDMVIKEPWMLTAKIENRKRLEAEVN